MRSTKEPLVTNQIEVHPFLDQTKVIEASRGYGMAITAYCPIARGRVPGNPVLERIGKAHGKTASQVSLRWLVQQGIIVIPGLGQAGAAEGEPRCARLFAQPRRDERDRNA